MSDDTVVLVLLGAGVVALVGIFVAAHFLIPTTPYTGPVMLAPGSGWRIEVGRAGRLGLALGQQVHGSRGWWQANTPAIEANVAKLRAGVPLEPRLYEQAGPQVVLRCIGANRVEIKSYHESLPPRRYVGPAFVEPEP